jgi:hypothetical protein
MIRFQIKILRERASFLAFSASQRFRLHNLGLIRSFFYIRLQRLWKLLIRSFCT